MPNDDSDDSYSSDDSNPVSNLKLSPWVTFALIIGLAAFSWWQSQRSPKQDANVADTKVTSERSKTESASNASPNSDLPEIQSARSASQPDEDEPTEVEIVPDHKLASQPVGHADRKLDPAIQPKASESASKSQRRSNDFSTEIRDKRSKHGNTNGDTRSATNPNRSPEKASGKSGDSAFKLENQTIKDLDGKVAFKGTIDLKPTIDRIERGESNRHRNDGTSFQNREGRLPRKPAGYYKEYVHPTPGINGPGPQRLIFGENGEIWYTPDHYKSFREIGKEK